MRILQSGGSSPLTRGKRPVSSRGRPSPGLIPAHAGKTRLPRRAFRRCRAHPRSRGENPLLARSSRAAWGSSPLTRGKHQERVSRTRNAGLIPAHAGKTLRCSGSETAGGAHPRSRGENATVPRIRSSSAGSSPLTRGKPDLGAYLEVRLRLIPAHAGKTQILRSRRAR